MHSGYNSDEAEVGIGDRGLGKVPGNEAKVRRDSGEAAVRRGGEATAARGSAPARRSWGWYWGAEVAATGWEEGADGRPGV